MNDMGVVIPIWDQKILQNKNAVITGGTSGIGLAMAKTYLNAGCSAVLITSRTTDRLDGAIHELKQLYPNQEVCGCILDLANFDSLNDSFEETCKKMPVIDVWVNNAGIYKGTRFGEVTEEQWDDLMDINLKAQYFLSQKIAGYMIEKSIHGNILNICSSSSYRPSVDPYMLSKLGMSGLTLGMAKKLIPYGIVVNGIAPGPTFTPMLHKKDGDSLQHGGVPAGRYILPQEIANCAVFLTSSMGRMIVGDVIKMTGGSAVTTYDDVRY